jgi:hypothetical protein
MKKSEENLNVINNFILHYTHDRKENDCEEMYQAAIDYIAEDHVDGVEADELVTLEEELQKRMKEDRDLVLVEVAGDSYNRLMEDHADELSGMMGVSSYIAEVVDRVLSSEPYTKAVQYEKEGKGNRWDYMHIMHSNSLDWFFLDMANDIINKEYPKINK